MITIKHLIKTATVIILAAAALLNSSCSIKSDMSECPFDKGKDYSAMKIIVAGEEPSTKSVVTVDTDIIRSINVFAFDSETGAMLVYEEGAGDAFVGKPISLYISGNVSSFEWILPTNQEMDIYAVANMPQISVPSDLQSFLACNGVKYSITSMTQLNDTAIPMSGIVENFTENGAGNSLTIQMKRVVARYNLKVIPDPDEQNIIKSFTVKQVRLCNMPKAINLFGSNECVKSAAELLNSGAAGDWATDSDLLKINNGTGVDFFCFENMQTTSNNVSYTGNTNWENVHTYFTNNNKGQYCTYLEVVTETVYNDGSLDPNPTKRIYLGMDCKTNFDIKRNVSKNLVLNHKDLGIDRTNLEFDDKNCPESVTAGASTSSSFVLTYDTDMHPDILEEDKIKFQILKNKVPINTSLYDITASWVQKPSKSSQSATISVSCGKNVPDNSQFELYAYIEGYEYKEETKDYAPFTVINKPVADDGFVRWQQDQYEVTAGKTAELLFDYKFNDADLVDELGTESTLKVYENGVLNSSLRIEHDNDYFSLSETDCPISFYCPYDDPSGKEYTVVLEVGNYRDECTVIVRNLFEIEWKRGYFYTSDWGEIDVNSNIMSPDGLTGFESGGVMMDLLYEDFSYIDGGMTDGVYMREDKKGSVFFYKETFTENESITSGVYRVRIPFRCDGVTEPVDIFLTVEYDESVPSLSLYTNELIVDLQGKGVRQFKNETSATMTMTWGDVGGETITLEPGESYYATETYISCMELGFYGGSASSYEMLCSCSDYYYRNFSYIFYNNTEIISIIPEYLNSVSDVFNWANTSHNSYSCYYRFIDYR